MARTKQPVLLRKALVQTTYRASPKKHGLRPRLPSISSLKAVEKPPTFDSGHQSWNIRGRSVVYSPCGVAIATIGTTNARTSPEVLFCTRGCARFQGDIESLADQTFVPPNEEQLQEEVRRLTRIRELSADFLKAFAADWHATFSPEHDRTPHESARTQALFSAIPALY
jgi:hypothetical protein